MRWSMPRGSECQKAKGRARPEGSGRAVLFVMQASGAHRSDAPYQRRTNASGFGRTGTPLQTVIFAIKAGGAHRSDAPYCPAARLMRRITFVNRLKYF